MGCCTIDVKGTISLCNVVSSSLRRKQQEIPQDFTSFRHLAPVPRSTSPTILCFCYASILLLSLRRHILETQTVIRGARRSPESSPFPVPASFLSSLSPHPLSCLRFPSSRLSSSACYAFAKEEVSLSLSASASYGASLIF